MSNLYHYCSTDTFFKILNSKTIWMSDIFSMNDYFEYIWFFEVVKKNNQSSFDNMVFHKIKEKIDIENSIYITCFSEESDLLSQWRGYADDGKGFSIGFKKDELKKLAELYNVEYCSTRIPKELENILRKIEKDSSKWICDIENKIKEYAPITKNHKFSEEKEWRMIEKISKKSDLSIIKWRNSSNKIIPYIEKYFNNETIIEIIIGPKNDTTIENMELFLKSIGMGNINVIKSEISYR